MFSPTVSYWGKYEVFTLPQPTPMIFLAAWWVPLGSPGCRSKAYRERLLFWILYAGTRSLMSRAVCGTVCELSTAKCTLLNWALLACWFCFILYYLVIFFCILLHHYNLYRLRSFIHVMSGHVTSSGPVRGGGNFAHQKKFALIFIKKTKFGSGLQKQIFLPY